MSKPRHSSTHPIQAATVPVIAHDVRAKPPAHPWVIGGIDYGPAAATIRDLSAWAFDLAARDVADWPEGQRRVRSARQFVLDRLCGQCSHFDPFGDVLLTTPSAKTGSGGCCTAEARRQRSPRLSAACRQRVSR